MKLLLGMTAAILGVAGCGGSDLTDPEENLPVIASVFPAAQTTGVDPGAPIVIRFSHPMMAGMERFVDLHAGGTASGPTVAGVWTWSSDRTELTFTHPEPLHQATHYTIHLGGGMRDQRNRELDHSACGAQGGVNAGAGMMGGHSMMGDGWRHSNGGYGMLFSFTTA